MRKGRVSPRVRLIAIRVPRGGCRVVKAGSDYGSRLSTQNPYRRLLPLRSGASPSCPGRFLHLGDQLLKGGSWSLLMLGQIDGGLPQAREVGVGKVVGIVGGQDFEREVFGQRSDQVSFGFGLSCHDGRTCHSQRCGRWHDCPAWAVPQAVPTVSRRPERKTPPQLQSSG